MANAQRRRAFCGPSLGVWVGLGRRQVLKRGYEELAVVVVVGGKGERERERE